MIPVLFVMWCLSAPAGYVAGDVFLAQMDYRKGENNWLPVVCALFPPLAAFIAILVLATETMKGEDQ